MFNKIKQTTKNKNNKRKRKRKNKRKIKYAKEYIECYIIVGRDF